MDITTCTIDGCSNPRWCRGFCRMHYKRIKRNGDPHIRKVKKIEGDLVTRFHANIVKDISGCWFYRGTSSGHGYGKIGSANKQYYAHRLSYEITNGPIPEGMVVRHKCRNRDCVNPDHLEIGTHAENVRDKFRDGTVLRGERVGASKLTEAMVLEIKTTNTSARDLAKKFNVGIRTVYCVIMGQTWAHVIPESFGLKRERTVRSVRRRS